MSCAQAPRRGVRYVTQFGGRFLTLRRVDSLIRTVELLFSTYETVARETPASRATSALVGTGRWVGWFGNWLMASGSLPDPFRVGTLRGCSAGGSALAAAAADSADGRSGGLLGLLTGPGGGGRCARVRARTGPLHGIGRTGSTVWG